MVFGPPELIIHFKYHDVIKEECKLFIKETNNFGVTNWSFEIYYPELSFTWEEKGESKRIFDHKNIAILEGICQIYLNQDKDGIRKT